MLHQQMMKESFGRRRPVVTYHFGSFCVKDSESLWVNDRMIPLSPLQMRLLAYLCRHPQQLLDKQRIAENVWGHSDVSDVSLARAIHGLRQRLASETKASELIRNIYGRGYIFTQPVSCTGDGASGVSDAHRPLAVATAEAPPLPVRPDRVRPISVKTALGRSQLSAVR